MGGENELSPSPEQDCGPVACAMGGNLQCHTCKYKEGCNEIKRAASRRHLFMASATVSLPSTQICKLPFDIMHKASIMVSGRIYQQ